MHTGQLIQKMRLSANLTQQELGEKIGCTKAAISQLEARDNCKVATLSQIAKICNRELEINFRPLKNNNMKNLNDICAATVRETWEHNNYQHTHDRVHFNPENRLLSLEEVCINDYGSCYGRGTGFSITVPVDCELPECLTSSPNWGDFDDLPVNYGVSNLSSKVQHKR